MKKMAPETDRSAKKNNTDVTRLGSDLHPIYRVVGNLGRDAFGPFHRAEHLGEGRRVAVKVLHDRLRIDRRNTLGIGFENTLRIIDIVQGGTGNTLVVLESPRGSCLSKILSSQKQLPPDVAVTIAGEILVTLQSLHGQGVAFNTLTAASAFVSRDIKRGIHVELAYLGVTSESARRVRSRYGVPPGGRRSESSFAKGDLWAAAAILHEMLLGHPPSETPSPTDTAVEQRVGAAGLPLPPEFVEAHPSLAAMLRRALDERETFRFPTAEAFMEALLSSEADDGAVARSESPPIDAPCVVDEMENRNTTTRSSVPTIPAPPSDTLISETAGADPDVTRRDLSTNLLAQEARWASLQQRPKQRRPKAVALVIALVAIGLVAAGLWIMMGRLHNPGGAPPETIKAASPERVDAPPDTRSPKAASPAADRPAGSEAEGTTSAEVGEAPDPAPQSPAGAHSTDKKNGKSPHPKRRKPKAATAPPKASDQGATGRPPDNLSSNPFHLKNNPFPTDGE